MVMWVWNGFLLGWELKRQPSSGDNITFDAARNFHVFGSLLVSQHELLLLVESDGSESDVAGAVGACYLYWYMVAAVEQGQVYSYTPGCSSNG